MPDRRRRSPWLPTWLDAILLIILLCCGLVLDDPAAKKHVPWLVGLQMSAHGLISGLSPLGGVAPKAVSVIEIDDDTFWKPPLNGIQPTDRKYLAGVVTATVNAGAAVIGLDFQLKSPTNKPEDVPARDEDNRVLMDAIAKAGQAHIPVVLATGLVLDGDHWRREPDICADSRRIGLLFPPGDQAQDQDRAQEAEPNPPSPACTILSGVKDVAVGYINLPADRREAPLRFEAKEFDNSGPKEFNSFALQLVSACEARFASSGTPAVCSTGPETATARDHVAELVDSGEFGYAGFISQDGFAKYMVRSQDLLGTDASVSPNWTPPAAATLKDRIVLIGATWHAWGSQRGPLVDAYSSPVGIIPGVYLHANYVEAVLRGLAMPLSRWWALAIEVISSYLLIVLMHSLPRLWQWLRVWLGGTVVLAVLALILSRWGWYVDFALISVLLLVHVFAEHYEHLREHAR